MVIAIGMLFIFKGIKNNNRSGGNDEYSSNDEWKAKKKEILSRDHNVCVVCGSPYRVNVYRKIRLANTRHGPIPPWEYPSDALVTLCESCHRRIILHEYS